MRPAPEGTWPSSSVFVIGATEPSDKKIADNIEKLSVCLLQAVGRVEELVRDPSEGARDYQGNDYTKTRFRWRLKTSARITYMGSSGLRCQTRTGAIKRKIGRILLFLVVGAFQGEEPDRGKKVGIPAL
jgi:hypothetical protein